jgi:hypothetical protein
MKSESPDFQAHEQVLKSIRLYDPQTVVDGPVVLARYAAAKPRMLWVLRETHGGGAWDLREFLMNDSQLLGYPRWHCTYGAVAKISYGLIKCSAAEDVGRLRARAVVDAIREVAVVNVNKRGGKGSVAWDRLVANAQDFTSFVERQIVTLNPEIIIAAGTYEILPEPLREQSTSLQGRVIGAVRLDQKAWLVRCYHTGQTRWRHELFYERILGALKDAGWTMRQRADSGR